MPCAADPSWSSSCGCAAATWNWSSPGHGGGRQRAGGAAHQAGDQQGRGRQHAGDAVRPPGRPDAARPDQHPAAGAAPVTCHAWRGPAAVLRPGRRVPVGQVFAYRRVRHGGRDARSRRGGPGPAHGRPVPAARRTAPRRHPRAHRSAHSHHDRPPARLIYADARNAAREDGRPKTRAGSRGRCRPGGMPAPAYCLYQRQRTILLRSQPE